MYPSFAIVRRYPRLLVVSLALGSFAFGDPLDAQGFYKDVFWDAGVGLDQTETPVFDSLGLSVEYNKWETDSPQSRLLVGSEHDTNGVLLYPDGTPRFRLLYTPGGDSRAHGRSLGAVGRGRIRAFFESGGSFVGICGGAAIVSLSRDPESVWEDYYHLWPGYVRQLPVGPLHPHIVVPPDSPLLRHRSFGPDSRVESVRFTYGSYPVEDEVLLPEETEILLRFHSPDSPLHGRTSCWSYRKNRESGTLIAINAHPENDADGERLALTEALFLHALDGIAGPRLKGELQRGQTRRMRKRTEEGDPAFTRIGDKQVHHFLLRPPAAARNVEILLEGEGPFDLHLHVRQGGFAFQDNADYRDTAPGATKRLTIPRPGPGPWYVGVECASTVRAEPGEHSHAYVGNLEVLNGVPYGITVDWEPGEGD